MAESVTRQELLRKSFRSNSFFISYFILQINTLSLNLRIFGGASFCWNWISLHSKLKKVFQNSVGNTNILKRPIFNALSTFWTFFFFFETLLTFLIMRSEKLVVSSCFITKVYYMLVTYKSMETSVKLQNKNDSKMCKQIWHINILAESSLIGLKSWWKALSTFEYLDEKILRL